MTDQTISPLDPMASTTSLTRAERAQLRPAEWSDIVARLEYLFDDADDTFAKMREVLCAS